VIIYHGSSNDITNEIIPQMSNHGKEYVYFSEYKLIAGLYIVKNNYYPYRFPSVQYPVRYMEQFSNMFEYFYGGKSGYIYKVYSNDKMYNPTKMPGLYVSEGKTNYFEKEYIPDVYEFYLKEEKENNFIINRYENLTKQEKDVIINETVQYIINMDLISNIDRDISKIIQNKIPEAWEKAKKISLTTAST